MDGPFLNGLPVQTTSVVEMTYAELRFLVLSDLARYQDSIDLKSLVRELIVGIGYRYLFWWRLNKYFLSKGSKAILLTLCSRYMRRRWGFKLGIDISLFADIGPGLKIEHFGSIFVNGNARIGMRCSIAQGVTLGEYRGAPNRDQIQRMQAKRVHWRHQSRSFDFQRYSNR